MAETKREMIYECEVRRRRQRTGASGYESFWKVKTVQDALDDSDTEFRCKDCHGAMKLHKRKTAGGLTSYAEHLHRSDSEYCPGGMYFTQAKDGRTPRLSESPVQ